MRTPLVRIGRSYRELAERRFGMEVCTSDFRCKRRLSRYAHTVGRVDQYGYLHWSGIDHRLTRTGLRVFLKLVAWARNEKAWRDKPLWWKLWRSNVEAVHIARYELGVKLAAEDSFPDRNHARWLSRYTAVRTKYPAAYHWMYYPFRLIDERNRA